MRIWSILASHTFLFATLFSVERYPLLTQKLEPTKDAPRPMCLCGFFRLARIKSIMIIDAIFRRRFVDNLFSFVFAGNFCRISINHPRTLNPKNEPANAEIVLILHTVHAAITI